MNRSQRKQSYVDNHVQGALLRRIGLHWIVFFSVSAISVVFLQSLLGDPSLGFFDRARLETGKFAFVGIVMLTLFPAFMLDTIRFSNRFVGPIARIRSLLRQLGSGKTNLCSFRENDFWTELAHEFNQVAQLVERQKQEIARLKLLMASGDPSSADRSPAAIDGTREPKLTDES